MSEQIFTNGIDADTGGPLDGDMIITSDLIAKVARGQKLTPEDLRDAKTRVALDQAKQDHFGVAEGIDETDLSQAGWSVIFPASLPQKSVDAIQEALKPLLDLRQEQASAKKESYFKKVLGVDGVKNGETKNDFLKRFGRGPGPADPEKFPYYALIVGSPEAIPFTFQYQLDVQYAVGRIYFDQLEDYYRYASSVVAAETKKFTRAKKAAFFGVANKGDRATSMSSTSLINPLAGEVKSSYKDWQVDLVNPENATKANLANYLGGPQTPSLFFSASHGISFKTGDPRQLKHNGALITQDWDPSARVPVTDKMYFSADDIASDADVFGMLAFIFACYGGGTPRSDNFYRQAFSSQKDIAPYSFISQLPLKLLSHPKGGALGVYAHVERAWGASIQWDGTTDDVETFDSTVAALLNGKPAGAATEYFNSRYAEISTLLTSELDETTPEVQDDVKLAGLWTSNNDARNYTFIGDPAVRLAVGDKETTAAKRANLGALTSAIPAGVTGNAASFQPDIVNHSTPAASPSGTNSAGQNFGLFGGGNKDDGSGNTTHGGGLSESLKNFMDKLGDYLSKALDDATSLEVSTYVAGDLDTVQYDSGKFTGAQLRAMTRISLDGDTLVCIPEKDGEVDISVWNIHAEMVKTAQSNRSELMKTLVSAATSISGLVK